jgi:nicotinamidase/pyrazinamidase
MAKALIVVDYQNDFLPGGALGVTDGHQAHPRIIKVVEDHLVQGDVIVLSQDWHPADHFSFSNDPEYRDGSWPPHCVQGTEGAEIDEPLFNNLTDLADLINLDLAIVHKGTERDVEAYSAFDGFIVGTGEPLLTYLRNRNVEDVIVTGLALDYCVRATALDAKDHFYEVTVPLDCTRPVSYLTGGAAIAEMTRARIEVDGSPIL